ncbi:MAG: terpene cyclase/mutase family protein [Verrucomicrobia bacterium]|nr:terpene cyclase/mutase family protein [Verrucomicrobiota bacterium]
MTLSSRFPGFTLLSLFLAAVPLTAPTEEISVTGTADWPADESLRREAQAAVDRGTAWLVSKQNEDGSWSNPEFPALTALAIWALDRGKSHPDAVKKGVDYILSCVHENGAIYREPSEDRKGGGLSNYNTALCMVALHIAGGPEATPVVQKARTFVAASQHLGGDMYEGGMGYDPGSGRAYADLSNSYIAYEAMRMTESVEDLRKDGDRKADLDWKRTEKFVSRVQNLPESNDQPWATDDPNEKGGFAYHPGESKAGTFEDEEGVIRFRSYGSMTYAGLLSFIYADVDRDDVRVRSAFDWATKHWTLDENPGMGDEGLYYFYNVLAKGLAAYGHDRFPGPDGSNINWRQELARKLVNLQKVDPETGNGYWLNETGRWWEMDPVLVTAYSLIALQVALGF